MQCATHDCIATKIDTGNWTVQAERQRQASARVQADTRRKGKSREAKDRAAADAEKAKAAERAEAEEVLTRYVIDLLPCMLPVACLLFPSCI